jgi:hypothetical protein
MWGWGDGSGAIGFVAPSSFGEKMNTYTNISLIVILVLGFIIFCDIVIEGFILDKNPGWRINSLFVLALIALGNFLVAASIEILS